MQENIVKYGYRAEVEANGTHMILHYPGGEFVMVCQTSTNTQLVRTAPGTGNCTVGISRVDWQSGSRPS